MLKRLSLAAAAALAVFVDLPGAVPEARAADVSVYGVVDVGLSFHQTKYRQVDWGMTYPMVYDRHWGMDSGNLAGSRFGLKGREALGNGWTVSFVLENGFDADTGALKRNGELFDREATLALSGPFGTVYAGRMGTLMSDAGSVGFYAGAVNPFGTGVGEIGGLFAVTQHPAMRCDNAVAYVTPTVNGFTGYAQVAMGNSDENTSKTDRYAALGMKFERGPLTVAALVDYVNRRSAGTLYDPFTGQNLPLQTILARYNQTVHDDRTVNIGGSYDFGVARVYAAAQYFRKAGDPAGVLSDMLDLAEVRFQNGHHDLYAAFNPLTYDVKGCSISLGASAPFAGGTAKVSGGYMRSGWASFSKERFRAYSVLAGYEYPLSARTSLYAAAGFTHEIWDSPDVDQKDYIHRVQAAAGMVHRF